MAATTHSVRFIPPRRAQCADMEFAVGLAVMIGQVPAMWNVLASDAVAHLCKSLPVLSIA